MMRVIELAVLSTAAATESAAKLARRRWSFWPRLQTS